MRPPTKRPVETLTLPACTPQVAGWGATVSSSDLNLTASVRVLPAANILSADQTSLAVDSLANVTGDWGRLPGPSPSTLVARGGTADAVYSLDDTITLSFGSPTDLGVLPNGSRPAIGVPIGDAALDALLSCRSVAWGAPPETLGEPFPLASLGSVEASWLDSRTLQARVVNAATATADLRTPAYGEDGQAAMIGRISCCILPEGRVRSADGRSLYGSGCSSRLAGDWGSLRGPSPANITLMDPSRDGSGLSVGDTITIAFDAPTDRGGVPIGWAIPHAALARGIFWRSGDDPLADVGLYSVGEGRWASDTHLVIQIVELHRNASAMYAGFCSGDIQARVDRRFGVRDAARQGQAVNGLISLSPDACAPSSGPSLYAAGYASYGALGTPPSALLRCSGYRSSASPELRAVDGSTGLNVAQLAAAEQFSLMLLSDGSVLSWGTRFVALGVANAVDQLPTPLAFSPPSLTSRAVAIAVGRYHALVLLADGSVCGFGRDAEGQLNGAVPLAATSLAAHQLTGFPPVRAIACGSYHSILLAAGSDALYTFGQDDAGQLGRPAGTAATTSIQASFPNWIPVAGQGIVAVAAGRDHSMALLSSGTICSWGLNSRGQLGPVHAGGDGSSLLTGTLGASSAACFTVAPSHGSATAIAAGDHHSLALTTIGRLLAWGDGTGAFGDASLGGATPRAPLELSTSGAGSFVRSMSAGASHTVATTARGAVWMWGVNDDGQLGGGCATVGAQSVSPPRVSSDIPLNTVSSWRSVIGIEPASLSTYDLSSATQPRSLFETILTTPHTGDANRLSIAGLVAPCRAACELAERCAAFTFPAHGTVPLDCIFYESPTPPPFAPFPTRAVGSSAATPTASPGQQAELFIREERERGGARTAAAGVSHTLVSVGLTTEERCPAVNGTVCGGAARGACILGLCVCENGWVGEGCTQCGVSCNTAAGRGTCGVDAISGAPRCVCSAGWRGEGCNELDCPHYGGLTCAGHGECNVDALTEARTCTCSAGWGGPSCQYPLCSAGALDGCSNNGACQCLPSASAGGAAPPPLDSGAAFRYDADREAGQSACAGEVAEQFCKCDPGFIGNACERGCQSIFGGCGSHGTCTTSTTGGSSGWYVDVAISCSCDPSWIGVRCENPACPASVGGTECSGRGACTRGESSATCACDPGFAGDDCSRLLCPDDCSGYGRCELGASGLPECACVYGWSGPNCAINEGFRSLVLVLSVAGGLTLCVVGALVCLYCHRAQRSGSSFTPADAIRRHRWASASTRSLGATMAIHVPKREPVWTARTMPRGTRTRVGPGL